MRPSLPCHAFCGGSSSSDSLATLCPQKTCQQIVVAWRATNKIACIKHKRSKGPMVMVLDFEQPGLYSLLVQDH